jgi:hypothetical protein
MPNVAYYATFPLRIADIPPMDLMEKYYQGPAFAPPPALLSASDASDSQTVGIFYSFAYFSKRPKDSLEII